MKDIGNDETLFVDDDKSYNKKINAVPIPKNEIGIDTDNKFFDNIIEAGMSERINLSALQSFTNVSQRRDEIYNMIDMMRQDSIISAVLETYAEDATEYNENKQIVWVDSTTDEIRLYVDYLLKKMNIDKHIYEWVLNLCAYGDIYIRLYRKSEYESDDLFNNKAKSSLNEDVKVRAYQKDDGYAHYVEMMPNPAEYFELTKHNKTYGFIKAPLITRNNINTFGRTDQLIPHYSFKKNDIILYDATEFVHGALYDNSSRIPEEVDIFVPSLDDENTDSKKYSYGVKRGQSLLYNVFKVWRELNLLENAILLNRITKSSVVRVVNVEVGNMSKEQVGPHLQGIKAMFEQKSAIDTDNNISEYTNPGPTENNIYVPTRNNVGSISVTSVGGDDTNVTGLADLDYFKNKFYGALRVPKQYFSESNEGVFDSGKSLALISSRYAKMIKRIQSTTTQVIEDIVNLMLIDAGLDNYIGKFTICMLTPSTQEEAERRENTRDKMQINSDIMSMLADVSNTATRLKILKALLSTTINDSEVLSLIQDEIDTLEAEEKENKDENESEESYNNTRENFDSLNDFENSPEINLDTELGLSEEPIATTQPEENTESEVILPQPAALDQDFTNIE